MSALVLYQDKEMMSKFVWNWILGKIGADLTHEKASLRKSGGQAGQRAEKALYSTPKF